MNATLDPAQSPLNRTLKTMKTTPTTPVPPQRAGRSKATAGSLHGSTVWALLGLSLLFGAAHSARAATATAPDYMTYQGFLVDANGNPLATNAPANYQVNLRIYNASTGGASVWSELQIVTVDRGQFSVVLGEGTPIGSEPRPALSQVFTNVAASELHMETQVTINGTPNTILPRLRLVTSPFAFMAASANKLVAPNNGLTYLSYNAGLGRTEVAGNLFATGTITGNGGGLTNLNVGSYVLSATNITSGTLADARLSANVALRNTGNAFGSGNQTINGGNLGVGTTTPNFLASLGNGLANTKLALWDGGVSSAMGFGYQNNQFRLHLNGGASDRFSFLSAIAGTEVATITGTGRLGINTNAPAQALHVVGNATVSGGLTVGSNSLNVAASSESLRIIRGRVRSDGTILVGAGTGFTVTRAAEGAYQVAFGNSFNNTPVVTVNALRQRDMAVEVEADYGGGGARADFRFTRFNGTAYVVADTDFNFIAIGPR
jgi:hypothetical protein